MITVYTISGAIINETLKTVTATLNNCVAVSAPADFSTFVPNPFSLIFLHVDLSWEKSVDEALQNLEWLKSQQLNQCRVILVADGAAELDSFQRQKTLLAAGAQEILERPINLQRVRFLIEDFAAKSHHLSLDISAYQAEIWRKIRKVANVNVNVLLSGETGVGKTHWAQEIHRSSDRSDEPFVVVNCANFTPLLAESQLFGHLRGSFTGADRNQPGQFELAGKGTIFLDEVNSLPLEVQGKLLSAVEDREFRPIGDSRTKPMLARVISASNHALDELVSSTQFRSDLFFRLNAFQIDIPALKDRPAEIIPFAHMFLELFAATNHRKKYKLANDAIRVLQQYCWPGNIRELKNAVEHGAIDADDQTIRLNNLPPAIRYSDRTGYPQASSKRSPDANISRFVNALIVNDHNRSRTALALGVSRVTLYNVMRKIGVQ